MMTSSNEEKCFQAASELDVLFGVMDLMRNGVHLIESTLKKMQYPGKPTPSWEDVKCFDRMTKLVEAIEKGKRKNSGDIES